MLNTLEYPAETFQQLKLDGNIENREKYAMETNLNIFIIQPLYEHVLGYFSPKDTFY